MVVEGQNYPPRGLGGGGGTPFSGDWRLRYRLIRVRDRVPIGLLAHLDQLPLCATGRLFSAKAGAPTAGE